MKPLLIVILNLICLTGYCQYPFEEYPQPVYEEFKDWKFYDWEEKEKLAYTITIDSFFETELLTIQLTSFFGIIEQESVIRIFRGKTQIQKMTEKTFFSTMNVFEPIRVADLNADGLKDIKILIPNPSGNGLAGFYVDVIYLIQNKNKEFSKISYRDMMVDGNREERDFDNDGIFEAITMTLNSQEDSHKNHNYWTFDIFKFTELGLVNANEKDDYPIMIQYLYKKNFKITNRISRSDMKAFAMEKPEEYDWEK